MEKLNRKCGQCQLCCYAIPVKDLDKPALKKCKHQKHRKGCSIYSERPRSCKLWSCAWLLGKLPIDCARPDRCGYVVDIVLDEIIYTPEGESEAVKISVVQVWLDDREFSDGNIKLDNSLFEWLDGIGKGAILRMGNRDGIAYFKYKGKDIFSRAKMALEGELKGFLE